MKHFSLISVLLLLLCCTAAADRLPEGVPENQIFTASSIIEAVGTTTESITAVWQTSDAGLDRLPNPYFDDDDIKSGSFAYVTYKDTITTNGGQISEVKSFSMDTHAKTEGLYNIQTEKVLTYTSQNGSHLMGAESYVLDVAGNWSQATSDLVCVFSRSEQDIIPAFCNKATASSKLNAITTAQIESSGSLTAVGSSPAALLYDIAVTPDANSASGYADGIVSTTFTVSVMEGRSDGTIQPADPDPLGKGSWSYAPMGEQKWTGPAVGGVGEIVVRREGVIPSDSVDVKYNGDYYSEGIRDFTPNQRLDPICATCNPQSLPAEAGVIIYAPPGSDSTTYRVIVQGVVYLVTTGTRGTSASVVLVPAQPYLEGYDELAATITAIDTATVSGGISQFVKVFNYQSGVKCDRC